VKEHPHALPVFSTDTRDEAERLKALFGTLVPAGPLKGRHVVARVAGARGDEDALAGMREVTAQMTKAYANMMDRRNVPGARLRISDLKVGDRVKITWSRGQQPVFGTVVSVVTHASRASGSHIRTDAGQHVRIKSTMNITLAGVPDDAAAGTKEEPRGKG
jgi:hypothetical protein